MWIHLSFWSNQYFHIWLIRCFFKITQHIKQLLSSFVLLYFASWTHIATTEFADWALISTVSNEQGGHVSSLRFSCVSASPLPAQVQFHFSICMSGASHRGCRMTSGPADPQSCCHPSSPLSPSWMVWSPSNGGQGSPLMDQRLLGNQSIQPNLQSWLAGWLIPPPPSFSFSLVMAKWRWCSSQFSTPLCMWISCYRIRNASACQGLAALMADEFVLSTSLYFHQCLDWEVETQRLIKFQGRISFPSWCWPWRSADQRLYRRCNCSPPPTPTPLLKTHLWISFSCISEWNNATTALLALFSTLGLCESN